MDKGLFFRMFRRRIKARVFAMFLAVMLLPWNEGSQLVAMAAEVDVVSCSHIHDESCGYIEAVLCGHDHDDSCGYKDDVLCGHQHDDVCGGAENCSHVHDADCGYVEAVSCVHVAHDDVCCYKEESPCGHEHDEECGGVPASESDEAEVSESPVSSDDALEKEFGVVPDETENVVKIGTEGSTENSGSHEHTWGPDGKVVKEMSCTEAGEVVYVCTVEGCTKTDTVAVPATGHNDAVKDGKCDACGFDMPLNQDSSDTAKAFIDAVESFSELAGRIILSDGEDLVPTYSLYLEIIDSYEGVLKIYGKLSDDDKASGFVMLSKSEFDGLSSDLDVDKMIRVVADTKPFMAAVEKISALQMDDALADELAAVFEEARGLYEKLTDGSKLLADVVAAKTVLDAFTDATTFVTGDIVREGSCGTGVRYSIAYLGDTVDDGYKLTISGNGSMSFGAGSSELARPWNQYVGYIREIYVSPGVTFICGYAFSSCTSLKTLDVSNVVSIGYRAFAGCTSLETLNLSNATSVGNDAFAGCTSLETLNLSNATDFGQSVFSGCTSLRTLDLNSVTAFSGYMFDGFLGLETLNASLVTKIDGYTFQGCTGLKTLNAGLVTSIGNGAFAGCTSLETLNIGRVTSIGDFAFSGCTSLKDFDFSSVKSIGMCSFEGCTGIEALDFSNITAINQYAFRNCTGLKTLDFTGNGNKFDTIGLGAFYNCTGLESIGFHNISSFGHNGDPFEGCTNLKYLIFTDVPSLNFSVFFLVMILSPSS